MKIKLIISWLLRVLLVLTGLIVLYGITSYVLSVIPVKAKQADTVQTIEIYVMSNGVHTDVVLPVETLSVNWKEVFASGDAVITSSFKYIAIGWGNKDFFITIPTWGDLTLSLALNAGLGMGDSALHIIWLRNVYEREKCRKLTLTVKQYEELISYILSYIKKDDTGFPIPIPCGINYGPNDRFFEAFGHYSIFFTCNTWTNVALKKCGQKTALWTPFEFGIMHHLK